MVVIRCKSCGGEIDLSTRGHDWRVCVATLKEQLTEAQGRIAELEGVAEKAFDVVQSAGEVVGDVAGFMVAQQPILALIEALRPFIVYEQQPTTLTKEGGNDGEA